jgi:hypothetical protein
MYSLLTIALAAFVNLAVFTTFSHAQSFVYPMNNQSPQQQEQDEFACYKWAKGQTGTDPMQPTQAAAAPPKRKGGLLSGAMGGAALGAVGGAIAGNAGKGAAIGAAVGGVGGSMRRRSSENEYRQHQQQAAAQQNQTKQTFNRAYTVCLEGRGYKVG